MKPSLTRDSYVPYCLTPQAINAANDASGKCQGTLNHKNVCASSVIKTRKMIFEILYWNYISIIFFEIKLSELYNDTYSEMLLSFHCLFKSLYADMFTLRYRDMFRVIAIC